MLHIQAQVVFAHVIALERALFLIESGGEQGRGAVGAARSGHLMVLHDAVVEHLVHPVRPVAVLNGFPLVGREDGGVVGRGVPLARRAIGLAAHVHVVLAHQHVGILRPSVDAHITVVGQTRLSGLTFLGGDDDYAVGTLRTVDGGRGSVLQDFDALDVRRCDVGEVGALHAVDDEERLVGNVVGELILHVGERTLTTDVDGHARSGTTGVTGDVQARNLTLQGFHGVGCRRAHDVVGLDRGDGAGQVALLHRAVTDDDHFVEQLVVVLHADDEHRLIANVDFLSFESDIGDHQRGVCRSIN